MQLATNYAATGISALAVLVAVQELRDVALSPPPAGAYLLGVLPNFAAVIAITFVLLSIWSGQHRAADFRSVRRAFLVCASIGAGGLLAWELLQKASENLVFDPHDVGATLLGAGVAVLLFYALTPRARQAA